MTTVPTTLDPDHTAELRKLRTQADKIRYACQQVPTPATTMVRQWLDNYGIHTTRSHASSVVSAWRQERGVSSTGELLKLTPEMLAELDQINIAADKSEREPDTIASVSVVESAKPVHDAIDIPETTQDRVRLGRPRGQLAAWVAFVIGGLVSVAANVAHTLYPTASQQSAWTAAGHALNDWKPEPGAMVFAAFWPIALILAVEVITRAEWRSGFLFGLARYGGTTLVAVVAAVMSYRHMAGLLAIWGEDTWGAHLGPLAVDGLMVVSAAALLSMSRDKTN